MIPLRPVGHDAGEKTGARADYRTSSAQSPSEFRAGVALNIPHRVRLATKYAIFFGPHCQNKVGSIGRRDHSSR
jgi:hypothetical protein